MDADPLVKTLRQAFVQTLSSNPENIKQAEASLKLVAADPGYAIALLNFISTDAPVELRQAAAVAFKNHVKFKWDPTADYGEDEATATTANGNGGGGASSTSTAIPPEVKHQVKASIVALMLSAPPAVRAQLSEALAVIGKYDYPSKWPELLPDLVARLQSANAATSAAHAPAAQPPLASPSPPSAPPPSLAATHGVLATANAICKRYRGAFMTDSLSAELEYSQRLAGPLLDSLRAALERARSCTRAARAAARAQAPAPGAFSQEDAAAAARAADGALDTARLACRVFFSLNSPGLTEVFEEALPGWMESLLAALTAEDPDETASSSSPGHQQQYPDAAAQAAAVAVAAASGPGAVSLPPRGPDAPSAADALRAAVCDSINLFVEVNEEEFAPYLPRFAAAVWALLVKVSSPSSPSPSSTSNSSSSDSRSDAVAIAAMRFLTTVARGVHAGLFVADSGGGGSGAAAAAGAGAASSSSSDPVEPSPSGALAQVCDAVVLPALSLRPDGIELFETNWVEYVRRDAEGADADTRRRAAAELARALVEKFPRGAGLLFSRAVQRLLGEAQAAVPVAWRAKDAALYLVMALMAKRERAPVVSAAAAAAAASSSTSTPSVVDVPSFFAAHVAPELASRASAPPEASASAIGGPGADVLAADALRFLSSFRHLLPAADLAAAMPALVALLRVEAAVVHSYAAIAIERLLAPQRGVAAAAARAPAVVSPPLVPREVLRPQLQPLLSALFAAFELPDSSENEYLMRCVARTLAAAGPDVGPFAPHALTQLARMALEAAANPSHPLFNHYLFESVAVLVRAAAAAGEPALAAVEAALFPAITAVLQNDVQEFHPYVFQVLAQLAEARPLAPGVVGGGEAPTAATAAPAPAAAAAQTTLPPAYLQLLRPLLAPAFWERGANVPALARLLRALLLRAGASVVAEAQLEPVLGVVQKLISSRGTADAESGRTALALLRGVAASLGGGGGAAALEPYLPTLWGLLFARTQAARTPRFVRGLLTFASGFAVVKSKNGTGGGAAALAASVDAVQPGLFAGGLLRHLWTPALASLAASGAPEEERKLACVATGMVLAECEAVRAAPDLAAALLSAAAAAAGGGGGGGGGGGSLSAAASASASSAILLLEDALDDVAAGGLAGGVHGGAGGGHGGYSAAYSALTYATPRTDDLLPCCPSAAAGLAEQLARAVSPACGGSGWLAAALNAAQNSAELGARVRELLAGAGVVL